MYSTHLKKWSGCLISRSQIVLLPLDQFLLKKRVSQAPGHEDEDVSLLPVGKEVFGDFDLAVVVEIGVGVVNPHVFVVVDTTILATTREYRRNRSEGC